MNVLTGRNFILRTSLARHKVTIAIHTLEVATVKPEVVFVSGSAVYQTATPPSPSKLATQKT
jgi:hypothetical protein